MTTTRLLLLFVVCSVTPTFAAENPAFRELIDRGVAISDGTQVKLSKPILPDGLDAAGQKAALDKVADARNTVDDMLKTSFYAPVIVKVRTVKENDDEGPAVRAVDVWFVAHGDWKTLTSKSFLESAFKSKEKEDGPSRVVLKSGVLTEKEIADRHLTATVKDNYEERFVYATFRLFERVELSATRFSVSVRNDQSILAAGQLDSRFLKDAEYPNQWRPLLRDERAEITLGKAQPFKHAGGYAKITRLLDPADGVFVECHIVYEEPYGWFDGINLIKQKVPAMVNEKVKTFRRKLTVASQKLDD
jgi:hypothetical protein